MKLLAVPLVVPLLIVPVLIAGTVPAAADAPPGVVLHIETGPGAFSPAGPEVTVFTDGRVFIDRAYDGPEHVELNISPAAVERLLDDARRAGALRDVDFGDADITDQATTTITVRAGNDQRRHSVYALIFSGAGYSSGDNPLTAEQAAARARLGGFVLDATDPETFARWETIEHPTGESDIVFTTRTERNGWGGEYPDAVDVTIYGDGRVDTRDGESTQWSERRLQRFLREARRNGLLGDARYGDAMVTDQGTTTVEIHAGGIDRALAIYALELRESDRGLPTRERQARQALRALLHSLTP
jgi:hypothetical protein